MPGGSGAVPVSEAGDLDTEGTVDEIAATTTTTKCDASANGNPYRHPYGHPDDRHSYGHPDDRHSNDRANDDHCGAYYVTSLGYGDVVKRILNYIRSTGLSPDGGRGVRGQDRPFVWRERIRDIGIGVDFQAMELVNEYITSMKWKGCLSAAVP